MRLSYIEKGSGFPLVLLHGFPFDHTIWGKVIRRINDNDLIITPDMRGFGKSLATEDDFLISDMASDVIELMDNLHLRSAVIAGHSMGGYISLEIARQFTERISGLGLIASHIYSDTPEKKQSRFDSIKAIKKQGAKKILAKMVEMLSYDQEVREYCLEAVQRMDSRGAVGALNAMAKRDSSEDLWRKFPGPKLIIAGDKDQFIPVEINRKMAEIPGNSTYFEIKNGTAEAHANG